MTNEQLTGIRQGRNEPLNRPCDSLDRTLTDKDGDTDTTVGDLIPDNAKPGVNYPPMHPFCPSSTLPVLPDEEDLDREWKTFKDSMFLMT